MEILQLKTIEKRFGDQKVLDNLTFSVPEHTLFGFVGENGAGKTTTMKLILGLMPKNNGEILVNGEPVQYGQTATNRFIGYLPDVPEFYSYMTSKEYLIFCGEISGMSKKDSLLRTDELLQLVGLSNETHRIRGFSRGMKQRLGIAQALFNRPKLLICDEPTSALDPVGRKEILDILVSAKEQTTIVFSTHILSDVERICDQIAFLHNGSIVMQGTLDEVKKHHKSVGFEVELEQKQDISKLLASFPDAKPLEHSTLLFEQNETMEQVMRFILEHQIPVLKIEKQEPSLESLFLEVVNK